LIARTYSIIDGNFGIYCPEAADKEAPKQKYPPNHSSDKRSDQDSTVPLGNAGSEFSVQRQVPFHTINRDNQRILLLDKLIRCKGGGVGGLVDGQNGWKSPARKIISGLKMKLFMNEFRLIT
jgi:hypothetical protein